MSIIKRRKVCGCGNPYWKKTIRYTTIARKNKITVTWIVHEFTCINCQNSDYVTSWRPLLFNQVDMDTMKRFMRRQPMFFIGNKNV